MKRKITRLNEKKVVKVFMPGKIVWKTAVRRLVEQGVLKVEQANKIYRRIELQ